VEITRVTNEMPSVEDIARVQHRLSRPDGRAATTARSPGNRLHLDRFESPHGVLNTAAQPAALVRPDPALRGFAVHKQ
jgi:hypothetical protein